MNKENESKPRAILISDSKGDELVLALNIKESMQRFNKIIELRGGSSFPVNQIKYLSRQGDNFRLYLDDENEDGVSISESEYNHIWTTELNVSESVKV